MAALGDAESESELHRLTATYLHELAPCDYGRLWLIDAGSPRSARSVRLERDRALPPSGRFPFPATSPSGPHPAPRLEYHPTLEQTPARSEFEEAREAGFASILRLPLTGQGEDLGALIVARRAPEAFSPHELSTLSHLSLVLACRLTSERQHQRAQESLRRSKTILDHAEGGFALLHADGSVAGVSKGLVDWIGQAPGERSVWAWLGAVDSGFGERLEVGWSALEDAFMPVSVAVRRLPDRLLAGTTHLQLQFRPVMKRGQLLEVVLTARDVTHQLQEQSEREVISALRHYAHDPGGFAAFLRETDTLIERLRQGVMSAPEVHTLKGNLLVVGARAMARGIDEIEAHWDDPEVRELAVDYAAQTWTGYRERLRAAAGITGTEAVLLRGDELESFQSHLEAEAPELIREVARWRHERVGARLEKLAEAARAVARELGKPEPEVELEGSELRLDPDRFGPLWRSLVHPVHNAVDHGLESAEARLAAGKPRHGRLKISARRSRDGHWLEVWVVDDGGGVDWDAVRDAARDLSLEATATRDLEQAFYAHPLTTKSTRSLVSGGGMGLSAVAEVAEALGGEVELHSARGEGTEIRVRVPMSSGEALEPERPVRASLGPGRLAPPLAEGVQAVARHCQVVRARIDRIRIKAQQDAATLLESPPAEPDPRSLMRLLQRHDIQHQELENLSHALGLLLEFLEVEPSALPERMARLPAVIESLLPRTDLDAGDLPRPRRGAAIEMF